MVLRLHPQNHVGKSEFKELMEIGAAQLRLNMVHRIINNKSPNYLENYFSHVSERHVYNTRYSVADFNLIRFNTLLANNIFM